MSKVVVIGGGAAGMMSAISAADCGHMVTLFEKNEKLGKKVFITGKGRCNVTNAAEMEDFFKNIVSNPKFMYSAFYSLSNDALMDLFQSDFGVPLKIERGNRVFPVSDKSSDIIGGLSKALQRRNVHVNLNTKVKKLMVSDGKVNGVELDDGEKIYADRVIVATGGVSYQSTGSTGDGYEFARATNHNVTEIYPALVPLEVEEKYVKQLQGLSLKNVLVTFSQGEKIVYSEFGEMLFTHFGISGPIVLSASSHLVKNIKSKDKNKQKVTVSIDLKPSLTESVLDERVLREFKDFINKDFRNSLGNLLPKSLIPVVIDLSGIDPYKKVNEITKDERKKLVSVLKGLPLTIKDTRGFNEAIITQGGVSVKNINPGTMESKLVKNLYFAGEVLDVDALTGGFNLQIAWSTAYLAGISIK